MGTFIPRLRLLVQISAGPGTAGLEGFSIRDPCVLGIW